MKNLTPLKFLLTVAAILFISTICIVGTLYSTDGYNDEVLQEHDSIAKNFFNSRDVQTMIESMKKDTNKGNDDSHESTGDDGYEDPGTADDTSGTGAGADDTSAAGSSPPKISGAKILDYPQYLNQGDAAYAHTPMGCHKTKSDGTPHDIQYEGCFMCSYMMVAAYLSGRKWSVSEIKSFASNSSHFSGCSCVGGDVLSQRGFSASNVSTHNVARGNFPDFVKNAIDKEYGLVMRIGGHWEYGGRVLHKSSGGHYLVIRGYDANGFYMLDPGSRSNTENSPIPWGALSTLPELRDMRIIKK